jgi:hypothetical protein
MRYEIVDKVQTFKDYLDGKIEDEDIEVVNFEQSEVWAISELMASDVKKDKIIFIKKFED